MATLGENSYVSNDEAETYFDARFNTDDWFNSTEQEKSLVSASGILSRLSWKGTASPSDTYPLAWPRNITIFLPINGSNITLSDDRSESAYGTIPQFIKDATCELALHLVRNGVNTIANESGSAPVRDLTVGTIRLSFDTSNRKSYIDLPEIVYSIIEPYLGSSIRAGIGLQVNGGA